MIESILCFVGMAAIAIAYALDEFNLNKYLNEREEWVKGDNE
jgi:hypothetical protein